jgi:FkbM family methyltransferase
MPGPNCSPQGHFRHLLDIPSRAKYLLWRGLSGKYSVDLRLQSGLSLRFRSATSTDYGVAWDIFLRGCYVCPEPLARVRRVVDLGANVGYSCLFWCHRYPEARIIAFEPHPSHLTAISRHLSVNGFRDRVQVVEAAADVENGITYLRDGGSSSAVSEDPADFTVRKLDVFEALEGDIDILKIDIEGGEYKLLGDPRFERVKARTIVLEWHQRSDFREDRQWCENRLRFFGYRTRLGTEDLPLAGLLWAFRVE